MTEEQANVNGSEKALWIRERLQPGGGYDLLIVERSFKEVLELVQQDVRIRG